MATSRILRGCGVQPVAWRPLRAAESPAPQLPSGAAKASGPEVDQAAGLRERAGRLEQETEQRIREARAEGLREGEAAAARQAAAGVEAAVARLARSVEELAGLRGRFRGEAEADLVSLAIAIARRILRREINIDPDALAGMVRVALEKVDRRELHRVRIHPSLAGLLQKQLADSGTPVEISPDAGLEEGAVLFETTRGTLDASLETQLLEVERGLSDLIRRKG